METISNPFMPLGLNVPNYVQKEHTRVEILTFFFSLTTVVITATWLKASSLSHKISLGDRLASVWWVVTGLIHMFTEGFFVVFASTIAGRVDLMSDLWFVSCHLIDRKEYALADSRYMVSDPAVWSIEAITAVFNCR
jgi:cholestenol delta-isomerase